VNYRIIESNGYFVIFDDNDTHICLCHSREKAEFVRGRLHDAENFAVEWKEKKEKFAKWLCEEGFDDANFTRRRHHEPEK